MRKGLTLVEMLVVLAIISILLPIGAYGIFQHRQALVWRTQIADLEGLLRTGSQFARSSGRPVELVVSGSTAYLVQAGQALHLQGSRVAAPHLQVRLQGQLHAGNLTSGTFLTWRPSGRVEGERTFQLIQNTRRHTFQVSPWGELGGQP